LFEAPDALFEGFVRWIRHRRFLGRRGFRKARRVFDHRGILPPGRRGGKAGYRYYTARREAERGAEDQVPSTEYEVPRTWSGCRCRVHRFASASPATYANRSIRHLHPDYRSEDPPHIAADSVLGCLLARHGTDLVGRGEVRRDRQGHSARGGPLGAALQSRDEADAVHASDVVAHRRVEDAPLT